jgi:hypothetical protein
MPIAVKEGDEERREEDIPVLISESNNRDTTKVVSSHKQGLETGILPSGAVPLSDLDNCMASCVSHPTMPIDDPREVNDGEPETISESRSNDKDTTKIMSHKKGQMGNILLSEKSIEGIDENADSESETVSRCEQSDTRETISHRSKQEDEKTLLFESIDL